jgi:hypothetical protein
VSSHFIEECAAVFAHSWSVVNKFGDYGESRAALLINSGRAGRPAIRAATGRGAIDALQCKRISAQDKSLKRSAILRDNVTPDYRTAKAAWPPQILSARPRISGQAIFAELWGCPVAASGLLKNCINTNWFPNV